MKFNELYESVINSVSKLVETHLKKHGIPFKKTEKLGFTKFSIKGKDGMYDVVVESDGIFIKKDGEEIKWLTTPKLDYKNIYKYIEV